MNDIGTVLYFLSHFIVGEKGWFLFCQQLFTIYGVHACLLVDYGYASHAERFWIEWQSLCVFAVLASSFLHTCTTDGALFGFSHCPQSYEHPVEICGKEPVTKCTLP